MTLEQVMALDGRELDAAVAEQRLGWTEIRHEQHPIPKWAEDPDNPGANQWDWWGKHPNKTHLYIRERIPDFSRDWSAAMQIRDWARGLDFSAQGKFYWLLMRLIEHRTKVNAVSPVDVLLLAECPDYARAALLVSVE